MTFDIISRHRRPAASLPPTRYIYALSSSRARWRRLTAPPIRLVAAGMAKCRCQVSAMIHCLPVLLDARPYCALLVAPRCEPLPLPFFSHKHASPLNYIFIFTSPAAAAAAYPSPARPTCLLSPIPFSQTGRPSGLVCRGICVKPRAFLRPYLQ